MPLANLHRAFPELDRFSDVECQRFIEAARQSRTAFTLLGGITAVAAFAVVPFVLFITVGGLLRLISLLLQWRPPDGPVAGGVIILTLVTTGALSSLVVRDRFLHDLIRRQVGSAKCGSCNYQLLGLPVEPAANGDGTVQCPECGLRTVLSSRGLTPAALNALARDSGQPPSASTPD